jgi:hypothetical protein
VWETTHHCYSRHDGPLSHGQAIAACGAAGGHLVTYGTGHEAKAVFDRLLGGAPRRSWIGFLAWRRFNAFGWVTHEPPSWSNWIAGEPRASANIYDCALESSGEPGPFGPAGWRADDCGARHPFVCEKRGWSIGPRLHAYRVFAHRFVPFAEAAAFCAKLGAHLPTVADAAEQDFLAREIASAVWLAATDRAAERTFVWTTGEPLSFRRFAPSEPDDPDGTHDCLVLGEDDLWHDRLCTQQHWVACERE